jgi:hypothetical protein
VEDWALIRRLVADGVPRRRVMRRSADLLLDSWELIQQLGRVPRRLIWDNEAGIGRRGKRRRSERLHRNPRNPNHSVETI